MRSGVRTIPELGRALASSELSSREITDDCLRRIEERDGELNAFLHVDAEGARGAAAEADERRAAGSSRGPLDGIPFALKDNIVARGAPTTCGSRILGEFDSPWDAHVLDRMREAGGVLLGKTNLDEFAMGSSNEHSAFGPVRNPHDTDRVPGGSSGGSCAAVAAGMAPLAFGTDTGGSVRLPAAYCGVVGLKPGYGRVSRRGLVAFGSSLDQIGPVTRSVEGCALVLAAVAGADPGDTTSDPAPVPDLEGCLKEGVSRLRVGVIGEFLEEGVDEPVRARVQEAIDTLAGLGAEIVDVSMPNAKYGIAAYYVVASAEASSNLARFDGARYGRRAADVGDLEDLYVRSRSEGFGDEVRRRILIGTFTLSAGYHEAYYDRAMKARSLIRRDYDAAFERADVLVSPVSPSLPFALGDRLDDPLAMYLTDAMTIPANLAGVPAMSVPCGMAEGLPVGMQIQAPFRREDTMLRAAAAYEREIGVAEPPALAGESS